MQTVLEGRTSRLVVSFGALLLLTAGCNVPPEEQVARLRAGYSAEISSITIDQKPVGGGLEEDTTNGETDDSEVPEGEELDAEPSTPVQTDVVLDVMVHRTTQDKLDGLTLDVTVADVNGNEKGHELLWIDTSRVEKGSPASVTAVLEDVQGYEAGDGFFVEVRSPVPPEERSRYAEFAAASEG